MSDEYVNRLFSSGALDGKIEALQSQIKALLQLRAMDAAELEALRADAAIGQLVRRKLVSGNAVPVERCTITAAEVAALEARKGAA